MAVALFTGASFNYARADADTLTSIQSLLKNNNGHNNSNLNAKKQNNNTQNQDKDSVQNSNHSSNDQSQNNNPSSDDDITTISDTVSNSDSAAKPTFLTMPLLMPDPDPTPVQTAPPPPKTATPESKTTPNSRPDSSPKIASPAPSSESSTQVAIDVPEIAQEAAPQLSSAILTSAQSYLQHLANSAGLQSPYSANHFPAKTTKILYGISALLLLTGAALISTNKRLANRPGQSFEAENQISI